MHFSVMYISARCKYFVWRNQKPLCFNLNYLNSYLNPAQCFLVPKCNQVTSLFLIHTQEAVLITVD